MKHKSKRKVHALAKRKNKPVFITGSLSCSAYAKNGFVSSEDLKSDVHISAKLLNGAIHGDTVYVKILHSPKRSRNPEGEIIKVISRAITTLTAVIKSDEDIFLIAKADNPRFYPIIKIPKPLSCGAKPGDRTVIELSAFKTNFTEGSVLKILGDAESIKSRIDSIIYSHSIKTEFDPETLSESERISDVIADSELTSRLDLRNEKVFTIDGADAKDFDDAVSIRKLPSGGYKLGVHIADVSHYVTKGSQIDKEALCRGTSVYLPDRVIPMLPENLSNNICSLLPGKDRLTLSCIMTIQPDGEISGYSIKKSVINSCHRMTYDAVEAILNGDTRLKKEYKDILLQLRHMNDLADILSAKRKRRGSIEFEIPEAVILMDKDYEISGISARQRLKSHRIIEEFMLAANETVAHHAAKLSLPFVYRVHTAPEKEKLSEFVKFLRTLRLNLIYDPKKGVTPSIFADFLTSVSASPYESIISRSMLRAMSKADYRTSCEGHFGLAAEFYCHFTSPIRRYPDLMVHRVLTAMLNSGDTSIYEKDCSRAAPLSSERERAAEECERDADSLLKTVYISSHIGEEFDAQISSLTEYGIYAELDNTIEGMIRLDTIFSDYFTFLPEQLITKGRRTGKIFRIGDRVKVVVTGADLDMQRIDFMFSKDYYRRERKDKGKKYGRI